MSQTTMSPKAAPKSASLVPTSESGFAWMLAMTWLASSSTDGTTESLRNVCNAPTIRFSA